MFQFVGPVFCTFFKTFQNFALGQGWATPGTIAELGTRALLPSTWARTRKRDPPPSKCPFLHFRLLTIRYLISPSCAFEAIWRKTEPYQPHSIPPNWGVRCHRGQKFRPLTTNLGWHAEEFCHWFSRFRHTNRWSLPAPALGVRLDNTKRRAGGPGGLEGRASNSKT